jgi:hypothetical protein
MSGGVGGCRGAIPGTRPDPGGGRNCGGLGFAALFGGGLETRHWRSGLCWRLVCLTAEEQGGLAAFVQACFPSQESSVALKAACPDLAWQI